ncbi:hypothetical protein ACQRBV_11690 [Pseudomonas sp. R11F]|uniref:hypothetical protein n=1 Tax=Pseudomonas TaxID=286 RepID=UPI00398F472B
MTFPKVGFDKAEWQTTKTKLVESDAHVLVLKDHKADFFRAKIVSGSKSNTSIYRGFLPSRERLDWSYGKELLDGLHQFDVAALPQFEYVDSGGSSYFSSGSGTLVVNVENQADGSFLHQGMLMNAACSGSNGNAVVNCTYLLHDF